MRVIPTRKSLSVAFGWHVETLRKKLADIGITHSGALTPIDLELIHQKIGNPKKLRELAEKFAE